MGERLSVRIRETSWRGMKAVEMEGGGLRTVFVPEIGGKIASLLDEARGVEWLVDPGDRPLRPVSYGAVFAEQDMSGWDEMFPTIVACRVPGEGPFAGKELPDHGEVWALPWKFAVDEAGVRLWVEGRALPYRLERVASVPAPGKLLLRYTLTNLSNAPWPYVWAAHPQFACGPGGEIVLPESVDRLYNVVAAPPWGEEGALHAWPVAEVGGEVRRLDRVAAPEAKSCRKHYVRPGEPVEWAAVRRSGTGRTLALSWSAREIPHLGLWVDEGAYNTVSTVALEPARGFYDSLERAYELGRAPEIEPGGVHRWELLVSVG